jgi:hypothetical protein
MKTKKNKEKRSGGDRRASEYGVTLPDKRKEERRKNENNKRYST